MPTIGVNGTTLYYRDNGAVNLPPLLCLHSLFLDGTMFDELAQVAEGRYRVLRPDFRGQGRSAAVTAEVIDMDILARDIEAFIESLGLKQVNAVVQSMGGDVILRLAARRPELFHSLVLLGTSARGEPPEQLAFVEGFLDAASAAGFVGEHLEILLAIMFGETTRSDPAKSDVVEYWRSRMQALPLALWPAMRGVVYRSGVVDSLPLIPTPSLVISGAEDKVRPGEWADEMAHGLPNVKHIRLPRVGHSVILEAPERAIPEIMRFLIDPLAESEGE
ncbi:alpha/beta fold hydrolase [Kineobactrum salinum]|uniref:Alpha/beta hydrolase n=1 Tax=Kineobactrum salinum TaxID=2708301 RepID=A0A6C0TZM1_9GAMM|nr:alpha/beta hydrolase [Kineobactrum salinum]QIB65098.1 alpha/beta hydrolase [Kineobactrum salinum]